MPSSPWPDRLARAYAVFRGAVFVLYSVSLIVAPERVIAGGASEPARTLGLMFASRTVLFGIAFAVLAIGGRREGLAWFFLADAALQLFDTGMAVVTGKLALAGLPAALGVLDVWAGLFLLRAVRMARASPAH